MLDARGVTLDMPKAGMMAIVALMHTHRVAKKKKHQQNIQPLAAMYAAAKNTHGT